jgi:hypothetical protein
LQLAGVADVCFIALVHGVAARRPARVEMICRVLAVMMDVVKRIDFVQM